MGAQRVRTRSNGPLETRHRIHDHAARGKVCSPELFPPPFDRPRCGRTMSAFTVHSPGWSPSTQVVIDTGPLPGTTPSIVSSLTKASLTPGLPSTSARCPANRTTAVYGSPRSPGSNQWETDRPSSSDSCPAAAGLLGLCSIAVARGVGLRLPLRREAFRRDKGILHLSVRWRPGNGHDHTVDVLPERSMRRRCEVSQAAGARDGVIGWRGPPLPVHDAKARPPEWEPVRSADSQQRLSRLSSSERRFDLG